MCKLKKFNWAFAVGVFGSAAIVIYGILALARVVF